MVLINLAYNLIYGNSFLSYMILFSKQNTFFTYDFKIPIQGLKCFWFNVSFLLFFNKTELMHGKTNVSEDSDQPGHPPRSIRES